MQKENHSMPGAGAGAAVPQQKSRTNAVSTIRIEISETEVIITGPSLAGIAQRLQEQGALAIDGMGSMGNHEQEQGAKVAPATTEPMKKKRFVSKATREKLSLAMKKRHAMEMKKAAAAAKALGAHA